MTSELKCIEGMAGLSGIRGSSFAITTGFGALPATILYTFFGQQVSVLEEHFPILITTTLVLTCVNQRKIVLKALP